jgi:hypothetical protein
MNAAILSEPHYLAPLTQRVLSCAVIFLKWRQFERYRVRERGKLLAFSSSAAQSS